MDVLQQENVRLMANFKLIVRKTLQKNVDLEALVQSPVYARKCLAEIEEVAESEELLIMVMRLRKILLAGQPLPGEVAAPEAEAAGKESRNYKFGARSW